jgi:integration host factor subunit beta
MTKAELVEQVAATLALPKRQAATVVQLFWQSIMDALEAGDHVALRGFGSFRVRARRPRLGRNPHTGAPVAIPAKQVPWFKPVLPTSPRDSRFSLAYSHPYARHPMTWRQLCRSRPHCTQNTNWTN